MTSDRQGYVCATRDCNGAVRRTKGMPIIRVEMFAGRDREQKRKLVKALTDAMVETTGANRDAVWVVINDVEKEDWGFGGELGVDKYP
ncbi:MAG: 2-hydroxymuconate tautomerase [Anderseniella sp.]|nr:2-hydroxymuconate tautomerase [Anderseniella sp.]